MKAPPFPTVGARRSFLGRLALEEQVNISNQNVLVGEAQFRAAKASVRVARAGQFPTVTAAPSATRSRTGAASGVGSFYTLPIDVAAYQVDIWGSIRRGVAASSAIAHASAAQLENARLLYQAELASDYFQIQGLGASRQLLDATVKICQSQPCRIRLDRQLTQDRFDGGVASKGDVALALTADGMRRSCPLPTRCGDERTHRKGPVPSVADAPAFAMGHVVAPWALLWSGLGVDVAMLPRPAPN